MPGMPWLKLYPEMLDDPKFGRLSESAQLLFFRLLLMAGECDAEGYLVNGDEPFTLDEIAWRLRQNVNGLHASMNELEQAGIVVDEDGCFLIVNFSKRQDRPQSEKRRAWRERKRRQRDRERDTAEDDGGSHGDDAECVTRDGAVCHAGVTATDQEGDQEGDQETEGEQEQDAPAAVAVDPVSEHEPIAAALREYGVDRAEELARSTRLPPADVVRWIAYARGSPRLQNPQAFVVARVRDSVPPPATPKPDNGRRRVESVVCDRCWQYPCVCEDNAEEGAA